MAKSANKQVKAQKGSDLNKNSVVIQKGISRSGRAIKPKAIFGESVVEIVKQTKKDEKNAKGVKPKAAAKKATEKTNEKKAGKVAEKGQEKKVAEKAAEKKVEKVADKKVEKVVEKKVPEKKDEKVADKKVDKVDEKKVEKVSEKPVAKPVEKSGVKKNGPPPAKKQAVMTKVVKAPVSPMVVSPKIIQTFLPKPQSTPTPSAMPKGFTPVNISAIMAGSPIQPAKPVMAKIVCVSNQPNITPITAITTTTNNNSNLTKTIVLKPVQKPMTYEQREKEIQMLRARLAKLEAEQEMERKARAARQGVLKTPEVTIIRKIIQKTALPTQQKVMIKPKPVVIAPAPAPAPTLTQAVSRPVVVTSVAALPVKTSTSSPVIVVSNDNRPSRKIKPTWKAMEQD